VNYKFAEKILKKLFKNTYLDLLINKIFKYFTDKLIVISWLVGF